MHPLVTPLSPVLVAVTPHSCWKQKNFPQEQAQAKEEICTFSQSLLKLFNILNNLKYLPNLPGSTSQGGFQLSQGWKKNPRLVQISAKVLRVPYLHLNKASSPVDLGADLTCLNYPLSNQLILKLPITLGAEEQL